MSTHTTLASRIRLRGARLLVTGPVPSLIVIAAVAGAGLSASALQAGSDQQGQQLAPYAGSCGPLPDTDGLVAGRITYFAYGWGCQRH